MFYLFNQIAKQKARFWIPIALVLLLMACGPGGSPQDEPVDSETETETVIDDAPAVEQVGLEREPIATSGIEELTEDGLPVGFTADGRPYIGDLDAPVVIEEFSDYQCPFCARFVNDTMPTLLEDAISNGEAVLIFYDFPLDIHPQAPLASEAARCAGEQSAAAYWGMHDRLFAAGNRWGVSEPDSVFIKFAEDLDLDRETFASCIRSDKFMPAIEEDLNLGISRGVTGTPTFFLNDEILVGAQPLSVFENAIATIGRGESLAAAPESPHPDDLDIPPFKMPDPLVAEEDFAAVRGDADAPILIVEYTDYQCPFCERHVSQTFPTILEEMIDAGRVRYALKDFPLDNIHPRARDAATAARCAGEQEAYWEMHDLIFENQDHWSNTADLGAAFTSYAADLNLDEGDFESCMAADNYGDAIETNLNEGLSFGVTGTPAFVIGGYLVSGAQPFDIFDLVVTNLEEDTIEGLFREAYDSQVEAYKQQAAQEQQQPPKPSAPVDVPIDGVFGIGDVDAPVVIVEYTDFQCPFCSKYFNETYPQIKENYIDTGLVRYVFKDFPLNFHEQAQKAAEAARCAEEQDNFLEMYNQLFASQGEWSGRADAEELFNGYATDLGLDESAFITCLESGRYAEQVQSDLAEGMSFGVSGTPTFFVNGQALVGALPYDMFAQAIESELAE